MISTQKQLTATKASLAGFEDALNELRLKKDSMNADLYELEESGLLGMIAALNQQVEEYQQLSDKDYKSHAFEAFDLADLPDILTQGRLVRNMTQSDLAKQLNTDPQQIQRYESNGYTGASFNRLLEIRDILDLQITCRGFILSNDIFEIGEGNEDETEKMEDELEFSTKSLMEV